MRDPAGAPTVAPPGVAAFRNASVRLVNYCERAVNQNVALKRVIDQAAQPGGQWDYGDQNPYPGGGYAYGGGAFGGGPTLRTV